MNNKIMNSRQVVNFIDGKQEISSQSNHIWQSNICILPRTHLDPFNKGNAPINVNPVVKGGGGGVRARGGDLMPETIPLSGF